MKKTLTVILVILSSVIAFAQQPGGIAPGIQRPSATEDSVRNTALDYADGYYSGAADRMSRAIHFDLNKAFPRYIAKTGQVALTYSTYSGLVEMTAAKTGVLADTARHIQLQILQITPEIALVRLHSAKFNDYLQMVNINGEWKIINVLWNSPQNASWLKDFKPDKEQKDIETAVSAYLLGIQGADVERLNEFVAEDFSRVSVVPIGKDGKFAINRMRFEGLKKNAWAGIGRQESTQRDNSIEVLDAMDGIAMVRVQTIRTVEYLQLYKDARHWKVFNSLQTTRKDQELADLLPAIIGEPMPGFTLPVYGGGNYNLLEHRGKNVLLMFPRGWVGNSWCLFCPYQYMDLAMLEKKEQIMKKYDLEIVFVMPYSSERIDDWFAKFPESMKTMEGIKHPAAGQVSGLQKEFGEWANIHYPHTFDLSGGVPSKAFPVLVDEKRTLSKRLELFTDFWDGTQAEQNVSAIYLVDKKGVLRWKYVSQITEDRPSTDNLVKAIRESLK